jgi:hypothetical protein
MHATPLHPRRALVAAVAAFGLALAAMMPATLGDASFSLGARDDAAPAQAPAPAAVTTSPHGEPAWSENPFAYPLLQAPGR